MEQMLVDFLMALGAGAGANLTSSGMSNLLQRVFKRRPDLETRLERPSSPSDFEQALAETAGELEALAGSGSITVDRSLLTALRSARFDHQNGRIRIGNSLVFAPMLETGGSGVGSTEITGETELRSAGTAIKLTGGARIVMTGNAKIKQN